MTSTDPVLTLRAYARALRLARCWIPLAGLFGVALALAAFDAPGVLQSGAVFLAVAVSLLIVVREVQRQPGGQNKHPRRREET